MSTAVKPVKKRNDDKLKADKKREHDEKKESDKKQVGAVKSALQVSQAQKRKMVTGQGFLAGNAVAEGCLVIETCNGDEEYSKWLGTDTSSFANPILVNGSKTVAGVVEAKDGPDKAGHWISLWHVPWQV